MAALSIRLDLGPDVRVGPGKVQLLEQVAERGSISAAGRALGMSYRRAWLLIDEMNRSFPDPVVAAQSGGRSGGGAILTPFGNHLVATYRAIERDATRAAARHLATLRPVAKPGILFFVVGPSGAGKDTLIDGARAALGPGGRYVFARRVVTRPAGSPGEDHEPATEAEFDACAAEGGFLVAWSAHGLRYGLRRSLADALAAGLHVVANGSRAAAAKLSGRVERLVVVEVGAPPGVLAARIAGRARESGEALRERLGRRVEDLPAHLAVVRVANDATPQVGVERFVAALAGAAS